MKSRTRARSVALQVLYEVDLVSHPLEIVLESRLAEEREMKKPLDDNLYLFVGEIVRGVWLLSKKLDAYIAEHAPEWPIDQVAVIDRNIMRMALWEFAVDGNTPLKVVINEAVELAKMFGSDSAPRFVNGVLGSLAERTDEISHSFKVT
jgi:N utilization substance protein B